MIWLCICLTLGHTAEPGDANHSLSLAPESAVTPAVSRDLGGYRSHPQRGQRGGDLGLQVDGRDLPPGVRQAGARRDREGPSTWQTYICVGEG